MKKKEVLKRLSAVSMAAMMTVTMIPSNAYAADELFSDVEVETSTDAEDEDSTEVAASDADDTSDADVEVEAEDDNADVNVEEDEEDNSEGVDAFSDGGDSAEETDAFDAGEGTPAADASCTYDCQRGWRICKRQKRRINGRQRCHSQGY